MKKKSINWKHFAKLYRKLGVYRVFEYRGRFGVSILSCGEWVDGYVLYDTLDDAKQYIFMKRHEKAKALRDRHKPRKIRWTHP